MTATGTEVFYERLPAFSEFVAFPDTGFYRSLPDDWDVVITDVKNSTRAIERGEYKQVNAIGVASIVAMANAAKPFQVPYVFGGDGAAACVPTATKESVLSALAAARTLAAECFRLELRIGSVPLKQIRNAGREVLIAKYRPHPDYQQAVFMGDGLSYAEMLVKDTRPNNPFLVAEEEKGKEYIFTGFECRWNEIPSPHEETITLMVRVLENDLSERNRMYRALLKHIDRIYGTERRYHPLRADNMTLTRSPALLSVEAGVRTAFRPKPFRMIYMWKLQALRIVGAWFMKRGVKTESADWGQYKRNLIRNTDYRKFDETLRMVISGTEAQRAQLREVLKGYRHRQQLVFGIYAAPSSLITCMITDYDKDHVHFLDASNGGYAMAARELKRQLAELKRPQSPI